MSGIIFSATITRHFRRSDSARLGSAMAVTNRCRRHQEKRKRRRGRRRATDIFETKVVQRAGLAFAESGSSWKDPHAAAILHSRKEAMYMCEDTRTHVHARIRISRPDIIRTYPSGWYFQRRYLDFRCGRSIPETGVGHCRAPLPPSPALSFLLPLPPARCCWLTAATRVLTP